MLNVFLDKYFYDYKMSKFATALDCSYGNKPMGEQQSLKTLITLSVPCSLQQE